MTITRSISKHRGAAQQYHWYGSDHPHPSLRIITSGLVQIIRGTRWFCAWPYLWDTFSEE